jgi:ketosteroid isomerase-like protein
MRHWCIPLFASAMACGHSASPRVQTDSASVTANGQTDDTARKEISGAEDQWERALKSHDAAYFERTMSDDFIGTTAEGISDKKTLVRVNADSSVTVDSVGRSDEKIRVYGNGRVGVVTGRFAETGRLGSRRLGVEFRYTEVWVKRDGTWQVVAGHYTPVEKARK